MLALPSTSNESDCNSPVISTPSDLVANLENALWKRVTAPPD